MPFMTFHLRLLFIILIFSRPLISTGQEVRVPNVIGVINKKTSKVNSPRKIAWERSVRYLGIYKERIYVDSLNYRFNQKLPFSTNAEIYRYLGKDNFQTTPLVVWIDTLQVLSTLDFRYSNGYLKSKSFKSFPVFIQNVTDSLASIGFGNSVNIIVEALDTDNVWKPIESNFKYKCGNGLTYIYLKSKEICCTLIPVYDGNFATQLRLNVNGSYSMPYHGRINIGQFID